MVLKVLHVAETARGGVATVLRQLLSDDKVVNFCLLPDSHCDDVISPLEKRVFTFKRKKRNLISFLHFIISYIRVLKEINPHVIYLHSSFAGFFCRIINFLYKEKATKVIYCPHAFAFMMKSNNIQKKIFLYIEKKLQSLADVIICTSVYEQNIAKENGLKSNYLEVIYNGVEEPVDVTNIKSPYDSKYINILYVGRFDYQKGFDLVNELASKITNNKRMTIIGEAVRGQDDFTSVSSPNITYRGWMSVEEIAPYFYYADVLFMPSRWESFGLVAVEAQSYGLPVVASDCCSLPEVVINNETGYLFETESITEAIDILENKNKNEWKQMRVYCKKNYIDNFTTENFVSKINKLYLELEKN